MDFKKFIMFTRLKVTFDYVDFPKKKIFMIAKLNLLYQQKNIYES